MAGRGALFRPLCSLTRLKVINGTRWLLLHLHQTDRQQRSRTHRGTGAFFFFFPLSRRMPCPKYQQSKSEVSETGERSREAAGAGGGGGGMTWLCDFQTHLTSAPRAGHGRARSLLAGPLRSSFPGTQASVRASRTTPPWEGDKPQQPVTT